MNQYVYDLDGRICAVKNLAGTMTQYVYDAEGRLLTTTNPDGSTQGTSYNGSTVTFSDETGRQWQRNYNAAGWLKEVLEPNGTATISSAPTLETDYAYDTLATTSTYAYDAMGRPTAEQQCTVVNCGTSTYNLSYAYDLGGKLTSATFPSNATVAGVTGQPLVLTQTYDDADRPLTVTSNWSDSSTHPATLFQASTSSTASGYGPVGLQNASLGINASTNAATAQLLRAYDSRGRVVYEADSAGALAGTDSSGTITISGTESQVTKTAAPGTITLTIPDAEEGQTTPVCGDVLVNENGIQTQEYECFTEPVTGSTSITIQSSPAFTTGVSWASGATLSGVVTQLAAALAVTGSPVTATVNSNGTLTLTSVKTGLNSDYTVSLTQESEATDSAESLETIVYGPLTTTSAMTGGVTAGTFYDTGTLTAWVSGTEVQVNWLQSSTTTALASNLASAINTAAGGFVTATASGSTVKLASLGGGPEADYSVIANVADTNTFYFSAPSFTATTTNMGGGTTTGAPIYNFLIPDQTGYAPNGNLLNVTDSVTGTWSYSYDNLNRLLGSTASAGYYSGAQAAWTYDAIGNRKSETFGGTATVTLPTSSTASYTAASNQVSATSLNSGAGLTYDAAGNVTADGLNSYLYDAEGRLCAVENSSGSITGYIYNAAGNRVMRVNRGNFTCIYSSDIYVDRVSWVLGPGGEQVTAYAVSGTTQAWAHTNVFGAGGLLATYYGSNTLFALNDWLGTKRVELGADGCASAYASLPYGSGLTTVALTGYTACAGDATSQHFTGKERDAESGNDYFEARYYSSAMGRFMSPDPSGLSYADPTNPQSLDLYSYVLNNPLHNIDPTGEECVWDDGSYDSADDPDTGSAKQCDKAGGTWEDPDWFESMEGTQRGDWSGQASSQIQFDMLTPSSTVNGNTPWTFDDSQWFLFAWQAGILPQQLNYGPWTVESIDMSHNFAVNRARAAYIKAGCPASGNPANSFAAGHYEAAADSWGNVVLGQPDWLELQVGGFTGTITGSGDDAQFTVNNPVSESSWNGQSTATGGHSSDNPYGPNGPGHNVMQTFKWSEQGLCHH